MTIPSKPDEPLITQKFVDGDFSIPPADPTVETFEYTSSDQFSVGGVLMVRCPHCFSRLKTTAVAALNRIVCSSCGKVFGVVDRDVDDQQARRLGQFELLEKIGAGGFGAVWKARDTQLDRLVAIKVPRAGKVEPRDLERFVTEARVVAQLKHPGIVRIYEIGRQDDQVYIVSDLIEGDPLNRRLATNGLEYREAAELCLSICDALEHAHQSGIVHRDLKPANILLDEEDRPHLTDFGLAKGPPQDVTITADGAILGTPAYMSPEQAKGESQSTDARSDIYSMGVLLFEMLTGERPFRGDCAALIKHAIYDEPPRPRSLRGSIPRDLETVCLKCLEKDPSRRYSSAQALAEDLDRWLRGDPILARPAGPGERLWRWCKKNPLVAGLLLIVLFSSTLSAIGARVIVRAERADLELSFAALSDERKHPGPELEQLRADFNQAVEQASEAEIMKMSVEEQAEYLQTHLEKYASATSSGSRSMASWYLLDAKGRMLAVFPMNRDIRGRDFSTRDYFIGAISSGAPTSIISEPYLSENDGLYKFAVSRALRDRHDGQVLGVFAASIATESSRAIAREERLVDLHAKWSVATLLPIVGYLFLVILVGRVYFIGHNKTFRSSGGAVDRGLH